MEVIKGWIQTGSMAPQVARNMYDGLIKSKWNIQRAYEYGWALGLSTEQIAQDLDNSPGL